VTDDEIVALVSGEHRRTRSHVDEVLASLRSTLETLAAGHRLVLDRLQQGQEARAADTLDIRADLRGVARELVRLRRQNRVEMAALREGILAALERWPRGVAGPESGPSP
jgi:hypothetical protein